MSNTYIPIKLIDYQDKWKDIEAFVKEHISDNVRTHGRTEEGKLVQKCFGYIAENVVVDIVHGCKGIELTRTPRSYPKEGIDKYGHLWDIKSHPRKDIPQEQYNIFNAQENIEKTEDSSNVYYLWTSFQYNRNGKCDMKYFTEQFLSGNLKILGEVTIWIIGWISHDEFISPSTSEKMEANMDLNKGVCREWKEPYSTYLSHIEKLHEIPEKEKKQIKQTTLC